MTIGCRTFTVWICRLLIHPENKRTDDGKTNGYFLYIMCIIEKIPSPWPLRESQTPTGTESPTRKQNWCTSSLSFLKLLTSSNSKPYEKNSFIYPIRFFRMGMSDRVCH